MSYKFLEELKYAKTHEWLKVEGDVGIVGISDYAQHQLGDIVFVEFPDVGTELEQGTDACVLESAKAAGDLVMPVSGTITDINQALKDNPGLINESPYEKGWVIKIKISDSGQIDSLLTAAGYEAVVREEDK